MITASSVVELVGSRVFRSQPPRGTPLRILRVRLYRCFYHDIKSRVGHATAENTSAWPPSTVKTPQVAKNIDRHGYATFKESAATITAEEHALLQDLLKRFPSHSSLTTTPRVTTYDKPQDHYGSESSQAVNEELPTQFKKALEAVQQQNTRRLLIYLRRISYLPYKVLDRAIESLPRTTFTEFVRALDPNKVTRDADPTVGVNVTAGMFNMLNLESTINDWGIRKIYQRLLQRMLVLMKAMQMTGNRLNSEEYTCLIRCAGVAGDMTAAKSIWREMDRMGDSFWRQGALYTEFMRARFLTEPFSTAHDKTRRMVLPRNLHRSRLLLNNRRLRYLDRLRIKLRSRRLLFGLNWHSEYVEDITRVLRKRKPIDRMFDSVFRNGALPSERLLCTFIVAYARTGSLHRVGSRLLPIFGIQISQLNRNGAEITKTTEGGPFMPGLRLRPTVYLMETIVEAYGCNSEILVAFQLINYISQEFRIPVPPSVWLALLEWTHIASSVPFSTMWRAAKMPSKVPPRNAVEMIWNRMMMAPHNVVPRYEHTAVLIRHLIGRRKLGSAIPHLHRASDIYNQQARGLEQAAFEYVQALRDGAATAATTILARYESARFRTRAMWYELQSWCHQLLLRWRPIVGGTGGQTSASPYSRFAHSVIPTFVAQFRSGAEGGRGEILPNPILYRTPSGYVRIMDPCREFNRSVFVRSLSVNVPFSLSRRTVQRRRRIATMMRADTFTATTMAGTAQRLMTQRRDAVLSTRSLAPLMASRLEPESLLTGDRRTVRAARLPRRPEGFDVTKKNSWKELEWAMEGREEADRNNARQKQQQQQQMSEWAIDDGDDDDDDDDDDDHF